MVEINGKEIYLNNIVSIGYINKRGYWEIATGRYYNDDKFNIFLDTSDDMVSLEETLKVKKDRIKYIMITNDGKSNMWR